MKMTVNAWTMKRTFEECDRDYYSMTGIDALLEYYDGIDENMEFDPVAICCDCTEYGAHGAACTLADMIGDYGYIYPVEEWQEDNDGAEYDQEEYIAGLAERLQDHTTVLELSNGNYIVFAF